MIRLMRRLAHFRPLPGQLRVSGFSVLLLAVAALLAQPTAGPVPAPSSEETPAKGTHDDPIELSWRQLAGLNYETGDLTEILENADGKVVKVPGFTVPLEDFAERATEFLLVPYVGACVHTPPPPPNQLVYIEMAEGKPTQLYGWDPIWIEGTLRIEMTESVYGSVGYVIEGTKLYPYDYN